MGLLDNFIFYDLALLVIFTIFVIWFLHSRRKNVEREGILYLYKTQIGVKIMDRIAKRFDKILHPLSYLIIATGYFLMAFVVIYLVYSVWEYLRNADVMTQLVGNAPPIALFIPYFPKIFGYQDIFPDFWFVYFIIVIAIIAIVHEGAHGIYARLYGIRIKSTGFGFLGPILAFFVEQDNQDMEKKKIIPQLSVLGAGVFANLVTCLLFFGLLVLFFNLFYVPLGINIVEYSSSVVPVDDFINYQITDETIYIQEQKLNKINLNGKSFFVSEKILELDNKEIESYNYIKLYQDQAAIRNELKGTIIEIEGNKIKSVEDLSREIESKNIGDEISIVTLFNGEEIENEIILGKDYESNRPVVGIATGNKPSLQFFSLFEIIFKDQGVEYVPKGNGIVVEFFYYLFLWIVFTNLILAVLNMLPIGIFDGGQFFYLTILGITKKEKFARNCFKASTLILLGLILLLMARWFVTLL
jgi:membrane-associated protease RseP (regulator of RpoE activity)